MENLGWLPGSEPGPRRAPGPRKTLRRELGPVFAHFCAQKASGDEAVTSGDEFSGLQFAGFFKHGERLEPVFGGKRANLEAQVPLLSAGAGQGKAEEALSKAGRK